MIGVIGILKNQELFNAEKARSQGQQAQGYHGLFSTHPKNDQRLQEVIKAAEIFRDTSQPIPTNGRFLKLTNGMAFGDSESQGISRGNKFYHKNLDLFMQFPEGWRIVNQPQELVGVSPDGSQLIRMRMGGSPKGVSADQYLKSNFNGFREGRSIATSEDQAYAGVATMGDQASGQTQNVRVSAIYRGDQAFVLLGQGKKTLPNQDFFDVAKNMRRLNKSEARLAKGSNIKLVTARDGDTFSKLASQSSLSEYAEAQLRLINNMYPTGEPIAGQQIKIIQ